MASITVAVNPLPSQRRGSLSGLSTTQYPVRQPRAVAATATATARRRSGNGRGNRITATEAAMATTATAIAQPSLSRVLGVVVLAFLDASHAKRFVVPINAPDAVR